jgi:hypothetical protein
MTLKEAQQIAHGMIQGFIGPDHRVMDMPSFYGALVQALLAAPRAGLEGSRRRGKADQALKRPSSPGVLFAFR